MRLRNTVIAALAASNATPVQGSRLEHAGFGGVGGFALGIVSGFVVPPIVIGVHYGQGWQNAKARNDALHSCLSQVNLQCSDSVVVNNTSPQRQDRSLAKNGFSNSTNFNNFVEGLKVPGFSAIEKTDKENTKVS